MPGSVPPPPRRVTLPSLTTSGQAAYALRRLKADSDLPTIAASCLIDALDQAAAGILRSAGLDEDQCRAVLFSMYGLGPQAVSR